MTIEEKKEEITKRVKKKLDENNIRITSIMSYKFKDRLLRDLTKKDVLITSFSEPILGRSIFVISDTETLEMLYVQTDVKRFMEIDDFFKPRED